MSTYLQVGDYFALFGYFAVVIGIGVWVTNKILFLFSYLDFKNFFFIVIMPK
jgi:hypothetical protein